MKLLPRESALLCSLEHRANASFKEWRDVTGLREHTLRYTIKKLTDSGVIVGRAPFIDISRVGLTDHAVFFSVGELKNKSRDAFVSALEASPKIAWIAKVGGDFQYACSVYAETSSEAAATLRGFSEQFGNVFSDKCILVRLGFQSFGRKYLASDGRSTPVLSWSGDEHGHGTYKIDDTGKKVLSALANIEAPSLRELARRLDMSPSTIERRVRELENAGVVKGYLFRLSGAKLGMHQYKLLINTRGIGKGISNKLSMYARAHPHILNFVENIGPWDYEMGIEVYEAEDAATLAQELSDKFPHDIRGIRLLEIFRQLKFSGYPASG